MRSRDGSCALVGFSARRWLSLLAISPGDLDDQDLWPLCCCMFQFFGRQGKFSEGNSLGGILPIWFLLILPYDPATQSKTTSKYTKTADEKLLLPCIGNIVLVLINPSPPLTKTPTLPVDRGLIRGSGVIPLCADSSSGEDYLVSNV